MAWTQDETGLDTTLNQDVVVTGSLSVDNIKIDGTNIGHKDDTDLLSLASGQLTANGNLNVAGNIVTVGTYNGHVNGNLTGDVIGNVTGNVSGSSGSCTGNSLTATTVSTITGLAPDTAPTGDFELPASAAAQPNITSLGTLTALTVTGNYNTSTGHINSGSGSFATTTGSISTGSMTLVHDLIGYSSKTDLITLTTTGITVDGFIKAKGDVEFTEANTDTIEFHSQAAAASGGGSVIFQSVSSDAINQSGWIAVKIGTGTDLGTVYIPYFTDIGL